MLRFDSIPLLIAGLGLVAVAMVIMILRRIVFPAIGKVLIMLGLLGLALAAGGISWRSPLVRPVAVMVDLSPSTRTAIYRNRSNLDQRIHQLLGNTPFQVTYFGETQREPDQNGPMLADLPATQTHFRPPAVDAVLLFSDARFELPPIGPPTFIVIDPALEEPTDASVERLELRGGDAVVTARNNGGPRELILDGVTGPRTIDVPSGPLVIRRPVQPGASVVSASFAHGDAWPENDGLSIRIPPPVERERWWVGAGEAPSAGWKHLAPDQLPTDAAAYLAPAVIVLANVAAGELSRPQQDRLSQYVRELGGALLILGGHHAFAAGGYPGSVLEDLSPLASTPPLPATHWILLADGSGSMSEQTGSGNSPSRWDVVTSAMTALLPQLPPDDPVTIGSFSDVIRWWSTGRSARQTSGQPFPPAGVGPHGPTNLEQSLQQIAAGADAALPKQLLLLTDADAQIDHPDDLASALAAKNIHLHLLAIGGEGVGTAIPALQKIITATGGSLSRQPNPAKWLASLQELMRGAMPKQLLTEPVSVRFIESLAALPARSIQPWDRTWGKPTATPMAETSFGGERIIMAAKWQAGSGQVLAAAFMASGPEIEKMAGGIATPPRDPRFSVRWEQSKSLAVTIDAVEPAGAMNGLAFSLELQPADASGAPVRSQPIAQTAPGRYALSLPAPTSPTFATLRGPAGQIIDRIAVAGRYAPEFDGIGNDHAAMRELANRTGGELIAPSQTTAIDFHWPRREVSLGSWLAMAGAMCIAGGLIVWRVTAQS